MRPERPNPPFRAPMPRFSGRVTEPRNGGGRYPCDPVNPHRFAQRRVPGAVRPDSVALSDRCTYMTQDERVAVITAPDGTTLVVRRTGRGTPVVLVHGSAGGLDSWDPVLPFLDGFEAWGYPP